MSALRDEGAPGVTRKAGPQIVTPT